jgi:hypothetical protein
MLNINNLTNTPLSRREMIRKLVGRTGTFLLGAAAAHPIYKHLADGTVLASADTHVPAGKWKPLYLNTHQSETLELLAERIIPNSGKAQVTRFVDLLLSVDTLDTQREFNDSLAAFDQEATNRYAHEFKELSDSDQNQLLTFFSTSPKGAGAPPSSDDDESTVRPSLGRNPTLRDHFENIKTWVRGAYYSSELGMRELGWTGRVFYEKMPACQHPDGHA